MNGFGVLASSLDAIKHLLGGVHVDRFQGGMCVDEQFVSMHRRRNLAGLHALIVCQDLAAVVFRVEEVLDHGVVRRRTGLVVGHGFHFLEHLLGKPLIADTAQGVDDSAIGDAGRADIVGTHLGKVHQAVINPTGFAKLADERVVQEGRRLHPFSDGAVEDLQGFGSLIERLGRLFKGGDVQTERVSRRSGTKVEKLLVILGGQVAVPESKAGGDHRVENRHPSVPDGVVRRRKRDITTGQTANLMNQISTIDLGGRGDQFGVGDVAWVASSTTHVLQSEQGVVEMRLESAGGALQLVCDQSRSAEVSGVGIWVERILTRRRARVGRRLRYRGATVGDEGRRA